MLEEDEPDLTEVANNKVLSAILQDAERQITTKVIKYCAGLLKVKATAYCYDGFQVLREGWEPAMIGRINKYVGGPSGWRQTESPVLKEYINI